MAHVIELFSEDNLKYTFYLNPSGFAQFRVKAGHDAHIALSPVPEECDSMYEIFIGGWKNTKSIIRKNRTQPDVAEVSTPDILNPDKSVGFWVRWENDTITAGRENHAEPLLSWTDSEHIDVKYIGFRTGWGATGNWIIERIVGAVHSWVAATSGNIPRTAFIGGEDNGEATYVIRARFNNALVPGKYLPSHDQAYISWGGSEQPVSDFEVLCDVNGTWIHTSGGTIPSDAIAGGETEDGEPLYIGRVNHNGAIVLGKVQQSHGVLYVPYGRTELPFDNYEILCSY